jgi:multidrug transporter EmrE-like cation transporter
VTQKTYKLISLGLAIVFGMVGLVFLFMSSDVLSFFDGLSRAVGMQEASSVSHKFYVILAAAYMYLVTLLASLMYVHPDNTAYPLLLFNGKVASSALSILFFVLDKPLLVYLTNGIVDGLIGVLVIAMYRSIRRVPR